MKRAITAVVLALATLAIHAKPMTGAVSSWEGTFVLSPDALDIRVSGKPDLRMWLYKLKGEAGVTAIGFSNANGDMLLSPSPADKGPQPVYRAHFVSFGADNHVDVLVCYDVQGNGGLLSVEKYIYDGKQIRLAGKSWYGGRHDPVWHMDGGKAIPAARAREKPTGEAPAATPRASAP